MTIHTATELVRHLHHQIAGSEYQDVQDVEAFVRMRVSERLKVRMELIDELLQGAQLDFSQHERLRELLHNYDA